MIKFKYSSFQRQIRFDPAHEVIPVSKWKYLVCKRVPLERFKSFMRLQFETSGAF